MDKRLVGIITSAISMGSVVIFLILGFVWGIWDKAWIVFVVGGIAVALVSMIGKYTREKKEEAKQQGQAQSQDQGQAQNTDNASDNQQ